MAAGATATLRTGDLSLSYAPLGSVENVARLPYTLRVLLENVLRDGPTSDDVEAVAQLGRDRRAEPRDLASAPAACCHQDFTGVPAIVDLAAMRDAMRDLGGDPAKINPLIPAELVIDHSVQVDEFATRLAFSAQRRARVRAQPRALRLPALGPGRLRRPQGRPAGHRHRPPGQPRVPRARRSRSATAVAFPDTLVGTDSHTTMVNGLGVLGWGVGGIEAEAAMLGEALSMLVPQVVGFRLTGALPEGATATDLVLTVTEILRKTGVVGKFVEYFGAGARRRSPLADRATIGNMSPEYGATCGFFPVDDADAHVPAPDRPAATSGSRSSRRTARRTCSGTTPTTSPTYSQVVELDLGTVEPSLAGPRRPQDRVPLRDAKDVVPRRARRASASTTGTADDEARRRALPGQRPAGDVEPGHESTPSPPIAAVAVAEPPSRSTVAGRARRRASSSSTTARVVIAAITSCTNTSNPQVMVAAGLLAKKAVERGLDAQAVGEVRASRPARRSSPTTTSRPASRRTSTQLGFHTVGYGCTTCIGNSGPLPEEISEAVAEGDLVVCAVLSGNRNFEARIHPEVKANYLASPPLVVAYALAGRMDIDLTTEPLGQDRDGERRLPARPLADARRRSQATIAASVRRRDVPRHATPTSSPATRRWRALPVPEGDLFAWDDGLDLRAPAAVLRRHAARARDASRTSTARAASSCSATRSRPTTSRPAGSIKPDSPAGKYLRRARRRAQGLQLVRLAPRQPRGDGARHVRERAPAQPARARAARARGRCTCRAARR